MKEKKYDELPEQEPMMVNEPAVAYARTQKNHLAVSEEENSKKSLLERKAEFIRAVLDDMDEETFTALESEYYLTYSKGEEFPCQFTVEELKQQIRQSEKEIDNGDYIAHEDLEKYILG